jgi:hypothetical protein
MHIAELLPSDRDKVNVLTATRAFLETMRARKVWFAETRSWDGEIARVDAKLAGIANDRRAELDALKRWVENTRIDANADPVFSVDVAEAVVAIHLSHEAKAALARFHDNRSALGNAGKDYVAQLRKLRKSYEESTIHGADKTVDEDYARLIRCVIALHELGAD